MIAINESDIDINAIKDKHVLFVSSNTERIIRFYLDIFDLLLRIEKSKSISNGCIINKVRKIREKNNCADYKHLLQGILKRGSKINNETTVHILRYSNKRVVNAKDFKKIKANLEDFLNDYKIFLEISFENNLNATTVLYENLCIRYSSIYFLVKYIFDYENWFLKLNPSEAWGPYQLTDSLKVNSCPYCNRQYTFTIFKSSGEKVARPELDHFLPKAKHPFLALSFFNLIPSCSICNSSIKGSFDVAYSTHLNPYEENKKHSLIRFSYIPNSYEASIGMSNNLTIEAKYNGDLNDKDLKRKVSGNLNLFCINDLYYNHADNVQEIIRKRHFSGDTYISALQNTYKSFNLSLEDAYRLAYGNFYEEKFFCKRTLSKLTKDIAIELGALILF